MEYQSFKIVNGTRNCHLLSFTRVYFEIKFVKVGLVGSLRIKQLEIYLPFRTLSLASTLKPFSENLLLKCSLKVESTLNPDLLDVWLPEGVHSQFFDKSMNKMISTKIGICGYNGF